MRPPRLASLALLLLALCRSASAGAAVAWDHAIYTANSTVTLDAAAMLSELDKLLVDSTKYVVLAPLMGNSLHALMLKGAGKFDTLPEYYKKALVNGVLCELAEADVDKRIVKQYGAETIPAVDRTEEEALAKALTPSIDCTATPPNDCFCTKKKPLLFCLAEGIKGTKGTCREAAVAELADKGKKALGPAIEALTKINFQPGSTPDDVLKALTVPATLAGVYCDAIDATVTPSVDKLYAADALYWTVDSVDIAATIGRGEANLEKVCAADEAKSDDFGKCICEKKRGLLSCQGAMFGKIFKDAAYLDCAATPAKFDETKKDAALAVIAALTPQPAPAPGGPTAAPPAGGNETTTAATGGAATAFSMMLAPLAAAAAALLLL